MVDRPHELSNSTKDVAFYEQELLKAFAEGRRVLRPDGIGTIVFASKTTASWEAILQAVVSAGWIITGSWPIDTELENRIAAQGQARLASSVHLVCRPRENPDGSMRDDDVGEWRDVLGRVAQADSRVDATAGGGGRGRCRRDLRLSGTGAGSLQPLQPCGEGQRRDRHAPRIPGTRLGGRIDRSPVDDLRGCRRRRFGTRRPADGHVALDAGGGSGKNGTNGNELTAEDAESAEEEASDDEEDLRVPPRPLR